MSPSPDRPLNDAELDVDTILSRFHSENAIHNAEELDGFFAALICSPEIAKPSEYSPEIWGEMADDEASLIDKKRRISWVYSFDIGTTLSASSKKGMYLLLYYLWMKKAPLVPTTGHAASCVARTCIMKAGKN